MGRRRHLDTGSWTRRTAVCAWIVCSAFVPAFGGASPFSWGGEYRLRGEWLEPPAFGLASQPHQRTLGERALLSGAVGAPRTRVFVELGAYDDAGRDPRPRPFDQGAVDVAQLYVEQTLGSARIKAGRQAIAYTRLVSTREASNVRRAFDALRIDWSRGSWRALVAAGRPVLADFGSFDDAADTSEALGLLSIGHAGTVDTVEAFYIGRRRRIPAPAPVHERRHDVGVRWMLKRERCAGELQASVQFGERDARHIHAAGVASDLSCALARSPTLRVGGRINYASGDGNPGDAELGTFDPLYPNLSYFTDAAVLFPGNSYDVHPYVAWSPDPRFTLSAGAEIMFRARSADANYQPPGIPLVAAQPGSAGDHLATLPYVSASWRPAASVELLASAVHGIAGDVLERAHGRDFDYLLLQLTVRR